MKKQDPIAALVDQLFKLREKRYKLQRAATAIEEQEKDIRARLIAELPKHDATGIAGKIARAQLEVKRVWRVQEWDKLYAYIGRTKAFDLLQRRLNESAIKERAEAKRPVPGVAAEAITTVSLHKL